MLPVDCTFLAKFADWEPLTFELDLIRALLGVDFELSFLAVFGTFLPLEESCMLTLTDAVEVFFWFRRPEFA